MEALIELPMGIRTPQGWSKKVVLTELTGEEEDILLSGIKLLRRQEKKPNSGLSPTSFGERMSRILSRCTEQIGAMRRPDGGTRFDSPNFFFQQWADAHTNDRAFALIRLRQLSLGDEVQCDRRCPHCEKVVERVEYNLADLEVTSNPLPSDSQSIFSFTSTCPSGKVVVWRPLVDSDEKRIQEIHDGQHSDDLVTSTLQLRLISIDGDEPKFEALRRMSARDRSFLRYEINTREGGIDTSIEGIVCPHCGGEFSTLIDTNDPAFFFPSGKSTGLKRTSSP